MRLTPYYILHSSAFDISHCLCTQFMFTVLLEFTLHTFSRFFLYKEFSLGVIETGNV